MDPIEAKRITKNLLFIKENITQLEKIMDKLIEDDCLGMDEREDILSAKRTDKQCHKLLDILLKRGGNSFSSLLEALQVSGNQHVAQRLQQTEASKDDVSGFYGRDDTFTVTKVEFEEAEVLQLYEEKQMYEDRVKELEVNCKILQNESSLKEHKIEKLKQDLLFLKRSVETRYDEMDNADQSCAEHLKRLDELENRYTTLEEENAHLKIVQRNLREAINEKDITLKNLDKERQFYKQQVDVLLKELQKLQKENIEKDKRIQMLNEQIKQLKTDLQNTRQAMDKMASDSQIAMEQMKTDHAKRFSQLDNKLDCVLKMLKASAVTPANNPKSADSNKNRMARKQSLGSLNSDQQSNKNISKGKPPQNRNYKS